MCSEIQHLHTENTTATRVNAHPSRMGMSADTKHTTPNRAGTPHYHDPAFKHMQNIDHGELSTEIREDSWTKPYTIQTIRRWLHICKLIIHDQQTPDMQNTTDESLNCSSKQLRVTLETQYNSRLHTTKLAVNAQSYKKTTLISVNTCVRQI